WNSQPASSPRRSFLAHRARVRKVAWKASSASGPSPSTLQQVRHTRGACRPTTALKASSSCSSAKRLSSSSSLRGSFRNRVKIARSRVSTVSVREFRMTSRLQLLNADFRRAYFTLTLDGEVAFSLDKYGLAPRSLKVLFHRPGRSPISCILTTAPRSLFRGRPFPWKLPHPVVLRPGLVLGSVSAYPYLPAVPVTRNAPSPRSPSWTIPPAAASSSTPPHACIVASPRCTPFLWKGFLLRSSASVSA